MAETLVQKLVRASNIVHQKGLPKTGRMSFGNKENKNAPKDPNSKEKEKGWNYVEGAVAMEIVGGAFIEVGIANAIISEEVTVLQQRDGEPVVYLLSLVIRLFNADDKDDYLDLRGVQPFVTITDNGYGKINFNDKALGGARSYAFKYLLMKATYQAGEDADDNPPQEIAKSNTQSSAQTQNKAPTPTQQTTPAPQSDNTLAEYEAYTVEVIDVKGSNVLKFIGDKIQATIYQNSAKEMGLPPSILTAKAGTILPYSCAVRAAKNDKGFWRVVSIAVPFTDIP